MNRLYAFLVAGMALAAALPAAAAEPESLGVQGKWAAWQLTEAGGKVCYMHAEPEAEKGKYDRRGDTYLQVTNRTAAKTRNVVSVVAGYAYKKDTEVELVVDGDKAFKLFTDGDTAWARDAQTDAEVVAAMRAGIRLVVKGTSTRGTLTTDRYSLSGFTAANAAIAKACGS